MPFDGVQYREADFVLPAAYHPHAPLTGPALGGALRLGYAHARCHSQQIIDQQYPVNFRSMAWSDHLSFAAVTWVRIAEGYRRLHAEATHLVAEVHFAVLDASADAVAYHRVVAYSSPNTDTGATTETRLDASPLVGGPPPPFYSPFDTRAGYIARCEVELAAVPTGATAEVLVQGYALRGAVAAAYVPRFIGVWMETRG